ncbi:MAG: hypothetical protein POELPBGB_00097 [Bacteroidia bacterium]|nr:hypothetical protein [Bacteroidia bacterium]
MKQSIFLIFLFCSSYALAQDIIQLLENNKKIEAKILRVETKYLYYKSANQSDTATYREYKVKIASVTYQNGEIEYYGRNAIVINDGDIPKERSKALILSGSGEDKKDKILFENGTLVYAHVLEIKQNTIEFRRYSNPNGPVYEEFKSRIQKIIYSDNQGERFSNLNKSVSMDSTEIADTKYFTHTLKINPVSVLLNNVSAKYEYRFNLRTGLQMEVGYIHEWTTGMENHEVLFVVPGYVFRYKGVMARMGIKRYFSRDIKGRDRAIQVDFFYKFMRHDKMGYWSADWETEFQNQRTRNVYGINVLFSRQRYFGHFLIELYVGASLRYANTHIVSYNGYSMYAAPGGGIINFHPPRHSTTHQFLPAIQGGINFGWGFNTKRKQKQ